MGKRAKAAGSGADAVAHTAANEVALVMDGRGDTALAVDRTAGLDKLARDACDALGLPSAKALTFAVKGKVLKGTGSLVDLGVGPGERIVVRVKHSYTAREALRALSVKEINAAAFLTEALQKGESELLRLIIAAEWKQSLDLVTEAVRVSGTEGLDLSRFEMLTTVGDGFLSDTPGLQELRLPASVESVGEQVLYGSGIAALDLSALSQLTSVGDYFLASTGALEAVRLPTAIEDVGAHFLFESGITSVDLSSLTALTSLGDSFCAYTGGLEQLKLPDCVECVGNRFLFMSGIASLDLTGLPALTRLGDEFLAGARALKELQLPSSLRHIGDYFLANTSMNLTRDAALANAAHGSPREAVSARAQLQKLGVGGEGAAWKAFKKAMGESGYDEKRVELVRLIAASGWVVKKGREWMSASDSKDID
eukprot:TRINITY_DN2473_c1_g3_i1.p1 TRINITY_DN2473_c1_g3~~TRINITY_DN2473_c1_g3_i1.p1  ORF type:complete len:425 (+),score=136.89 TRINITY_DN2473_c1_g3_i1:86-1360(+)